jgi:hypothetical protein
MMITGDQIAIDITDKILEYDRQIKIVMRKLESLNLKNFWYRAYIELLYLHGCLMRAQFDFHGAKELFELVQQKAETHKMDSLGKRAENAIKQLQDHISSLERLSKVSPHIYDQIHMQNVVSYIKIAQKIHQ